MCRILRFGVGHTSMLAAPEIAQFQLGDLTIKVQYPHFTYSSVLVNSLCLSFGQQFGQNKKVSSSNNG